MKRYYLAYGSNLNIEQMRFRCPTARVIGKGFIPDYELLFKGSKTGAYLTIEERPGSKVPVAVWEVNPSDERALDRYEGFPTFYYKKDLKITFKGIRTGRERTREAFVYIMHEERPLGIPSRYYVETCAEGYGRFEFDTDYLVEALKRSGLEVNNEG